MRMLPGLSSKDLAVLINCNEGETERCFVFCSAYFPYISEGPPLTSEFEELVRYCEEKNLSLPMQCETVSHHMLWGRTDCKDREAALLEFLNSQNMEILNHHDDPTIGSAGRPDVIDITQGFLDCW